jgi:ketosteroid isomerase-like protein
MVVLAVCFPAPGAAQRQADLEAVNQLIDRYGALEDAMDMPSQAKLMAPDRVWIGAGAGRRTDQAANMRIQQAGFDQVKRAVPGVQFITEDRDRLIRFYANGAVAVASFYRYRTRVLPAGVPREVAEGLGPLEPTTFTLVLEKREGTWTIVHTHVSPLGPSS